MLRLQHHSLPEPADLQKAEDPNPAIRTPHHVLKDSIELRHLQADQQRAIHHKCLSAVQRDATGARFIAQVKQEAGA